MKKFMHKLVKPVKSNTKVCSFYISDVSQTDNTASNIISPQTDIYKNFQFDCYHYTNDDVPCLSCGKSQPNGEIFSRKISQLSSEYRVNDDFQKKSIKERASSTSSNDSPLEKDFVFGDKEKKNQKLSEKKVQSNTYVISISNSKNFCIGSQKTVYANDKSKPQLIDRSIKVKEENCWESLLNCDKKLTENDIYLISQHIDQGWRNFIQNLGVEESQINNTTFRNDNNKTLIVYDLLMRYLNDFPDTSVGFVGKILKNSNQSNVVAKLFENKAIGC